MVAPVVIDASVTAAWCFHDEATAASQDLLRSLPNRQVIVPLLWHAECANEFSHRGQKLPLYNHAAIF